MGYTKDQLLSELHRCYEENGKVSIKLLNDSNTDYPTQPTYANYFGSVTEAKKMVGIKGNTTKEEISDTINYIIESGQDVSLNNLEENDIRPAQLYSHFESIDEALSFATDKDPDEFYRSKYLSIMEEFDDISYSRIDQCDKLPSHSTVLKYFDNIDEIRTEIGIDVQDSYKEQAKQLIEDYHPHIDYSHDGYIYCYQFTLYDETHFYVGETTNILNRMASHLRRKNIQTKSHSTNGEILCKRGEESANIEIDKIYTIIPLQQGESESVEEFTRRRLYEENKLRNVVVMEEDTLNVYGG